MKAKTRVKKKWRTYSDILPPRPVYFNAILYYRYITISIRFANARLS